MAELQDAGCLHVEDGNHGEYRPRPHEFGSGDTAFIRAANIADGRILFQSADRISDTALARIRKGKGRGGDVLFSHKGTIGKLALAPMDAPPYVCSPQTTFWRTLDPSRLDRRFLYYFMHSKTFRNQWQSCKGETDMADYVSLTAQRRLRIAVPSMGEQRSIARILGTLDDKIELNRRMNETLEAIARAIFKSWFVDFDPVRAKAEGREPVGMDAELAAMFPDSFEDSPIGKIPKGWTAGTIGDLAENLRRGVHPRDIDGETPYIALEHMPRRSIALGEWGHAEGLASGKLEFKHGEILFGKLRPYFHKVGVAPVDGVCSTDILVVVPKRPSLLGLVLGHMSSDEFVQHADATSSGTKMPRTNWKDLARYETALPPAELASLFDTRVKPLVGMILSNIHESRTLGTIRDALLPRLISGDLAVARASGFVGEGT